VRYLPTPELEIFIGIIYCRKSQEHEKKNKKEKGEQILSNFRQIKQCSLPQVELLSGDSIFFLRNQSRII
jgi:hypothetical protein